MGLAPGGYLLGAAVLSAMVVPVAAGGRGLRRRFLPFLSGPTATLASIVLGCGLLLSVAEALGAVGEFRRVPMVCGCVVVGAVAARLGRVASHPAVGERAAPSIPRGQAVAALLVSAVVVAQWGGRTLTALDRGMPNMDSLWYHMPFAARFFQSGWLTRLHFTHGEPLHTFFPANSEVLHAVGMLAFRRDVLSPVLNLGWLGVALLAGWCVGRARGMAPVTLVATAVVLGLPTMAAGQPGDATNDVVALALFLAAVALLLEGRGRPAAVAVAGVAAGLAFGTKLNLVAPVLALTAGAVVLAPAGRRRSHAAAWAAGLVPAGSYWYLRNLLRAGSPVPAVRIGLGPVSLPHVRLSQTGAFNFSVAHYATNTRIWRATFVPGLRYAFGRGWWALLALAIAGMVFALARRRPREDRVLGAVALVAFMAYLVTPQTAGGPEGHPGYFAFDLRFLAPSLVLGLMLLPRRRALPALIGYGALLVVGATSRFGWPPHHGRGGVALGLAALIVAGATAWWRSQPHATSVRVAPLGALAGLLAALAIGWPVQAHYLRGRYADRRDWLAPAYLWARHTGHVRIGFVGFFQQYPLYGPDLSNWVQYVGRPGPNGNFSSATTCRQWRGLLRDGRYDYVVFPSAGARTERAWTTATAGGVVPVAATSGLVVRLSSPPDPRTCPPR